MFLTLSNWFLKLSGIQRERDFLRAGSSQPDIVHVFTHLEWAESRDETAGDVAVVGKYKNQVAREDFEAYRFHTLGSYVNNPSLTLSQEIEYLQTCRVETASKYFFPAGLSLVSLLFS